MKHISSTLLLLLAATATVSAQSSLDLASRATLRRAGMSQAARSAVRPGHQTPVLSTAISYGFVQTNSDSDIAAIEAAGGEILRTRRNIHLVAMPTDSVQRIALQPGVKRLQLSRDIYPKLDKARAVTGIDKIHSGLDLPQAYTGAGVITGIVDGGMDPNHVNFKDASGNPRIKHFTYIRPNSAGTDMLASFYTPEQLGTFSTDDNTAYHGTHTMGIMAGSHRGNIKVGNGMGGTRTVANPYYGVATGSDIAASCGQLNDMFIAYGIEYMADFAYKQRKPLVVNLSLGSNLGSHDGRNVMSQYLDAISEQDNVTFCISAGNEGELNIALNKTLTAESPEVKTFIHPSVLGEDMRFAQQGSVQIYSNDSTSFNTQVVVYNKTRGRVAFRMAIDGNTGGAARYWVSSADYAAGSGETVSPELAKAFEGYVGLGSMIDPETGRFYAIVDYMTLNNTTYNAQGQYMLGISVTGRDGQRIDMFSDGVYSDLSACDIEGWTSGTPDGSISDMACASKAIIVGSYNTRDEWNSLDGNVYGFGGRFDYGKISPFSSYGTLIDGRQLPNICAPGATIISSSSSPFVYNPDNGITPAYVQGETAEGQQCFWEQMSGTSMASPLVAGSIALWLEADPTLTPAQIKEIAIQTARRDADVDSCSVPVQWGAGKFDAYEGLKEVLRRKGASNPDISATDAPLVSPAGARAFNIFIPGANSIAVSLHDLSGRCIKQASAQADELTIDCSDVAPGIYVVAANGRSQKIIVR